MTKKKVIYLSNVFPPKMAIVIRSGGDRCLHPATTNTQT